MLIRKDDLDKNVKDAIIDIAKKYGTPFYIYSFDKIESKIALLKDALCGCGNLYYSAKANPNIDILKIMQQSGLGVEVSSICELELAKAAGFLPDKIVFSGPGKDDATIERLVDERIRCINVESFNEIRTIQEKSCLAGVVTNISIRLNPVNKMSNAGMKMTGVSSKFGVDLNDIQFVIGKATTTTFPYPSVKGIGLHFQLFHSGGSYNLSVPPTIADGLKLCNIEFYRLSAFVFALCLSNFYALFLTL